MIICPNCMHKNPPGSIVCADCGVTLVENDLSTQNIRTDRVDFPHGMETNSSMTPGHIADNAWGSLHLMNSGQILSLANRDEFTLGRISEGQPVLPDLDLSPYQAYAAGVSRIHALLKRDGQRVVIVDLGSANGTFVNGKRLTAHVERLLSHGDVVALGRLKFQVLIR